MSAPATGVHVRAAGWHTVHGQRRRQPWADPIATHPDHESAAADAARREAEAWTALKFNPFGYDAGCLFYLTSLPDGVLRDWFLDHGVDPPGPGVAWADWYARERPDPMLVMAALDKLRLFDVAEAWPEAHVVADAVTYSYELPDHPDRRRFCHQPYWAWPDKGAAHAYAARVSLDPVSGIPNDFVTILPVEWCATASGVVAMVSRIPFGPDGDPGRVPLVVVSDRSAANAHANLLAATATRTLNPFAVLAWQPDGFTDALHLADVPVTYREPWRRSSGDWAAWYDTEVAQYADADRDAVWDALDQPLYIVDEVPFGTG